MPCVRRSERLVAIPAIRPHRMACKPASKYNVAFKAMRSAQGVPVLTGRGCARPRESQPVRRVRGTCRWAQHAAANGFFLADRVWTVYGFRPSRALNLA